MNSRDGFPQTGADEVRISPSSGAADRAAQAYEKAFLESAHSNESKLRLLEERMKRPQSTAQMSDAVRAGAPEPHSDDDDDDDEQRGFGVHYSHPEKKQRRGSGPSPASPLGGNPKSASAKAADGSLGGKQSIENYFRPRDGSGVSPPAPPLFTTPAHRAGTERKENHPPGSAEVAGAGSGRAPRGSANRADHEWAAALEQARAEARREADESKRKASKLESELASASSRADALAAELAAARERDAAAESARAAQEASRVEGVKALAVKVAQFERQQLREKMAEVGLRLGTVSVQRAGAALQEVWEDGRAFADLNERARKLAQARDAADEQRKAVKRNLPLPGSSISPEEAAARQAEYVLSEEVHKVRMAAVKREEDGIAREREALEREKQAHIRELKRARDEDSSRFNQHPLLGGRYVLMNMLGRGGFSEVYKAYDIVEMREVACKLHQLSPQWSEARKQTYVRHAQRECMIHKRLSHPNVVEMIDVFEVDRDSFCTVLELCTGDDLDARLKAQGPIAEREARAILAQVFAGLAYLNEGTKKIIHYDLKPGNILFDAAGRVKITDFGLSKVDDRAGAGGGGSLMEASGMELTSQGAGTYWYLPPECFETGPAPPRISSKVDSWSCGVILYQMLFGRRPFGHDQSQEQILHSGTILNATTVEFPATPKVSAECKAFISRLLERRQADRPDVPTAASDPYMTYAKPATE